MKNLIIIIFLTIGTIGTLQAQKQVKHEQGKGIQNDSLGTYTWKSSEFGKPEKSYFPKILPGSQNKTSTNLNTGDVITVFPEFQNLPINTTYPGNWSSNIIWGKTFGHAAVSLKKEDWKHSLQADMLANLEPGKSYSYCLEVEGHPDNGNDALLILDKEGNFFGYESIQSGFQTFTGDFVVSKITKEIILEVNFTPNSDSAVVVHSMKIYENHSNNNKLQPTNYLGETAESIGYYWLNTGCGALSGETVFIIGPEVEEVSIGVYKLTESGLYTITYSNGYVDQINVELIEPIFSTTNLNYKFCKNEEVTLIITDFNKFDNVTIYRWYNPNWYIVAENESIFQLENWKTYYIRFEIGNDIVFARVGQEESYTFLEESPSRCNDTDGKTFSITDYDITNEMWWNWEVYTGNGWYYEILDTLTLDNTDIESIRLSGYRETTPGIFCRYDIKIEPEFNELPNPELEIINHCDSTTAVITNYEDSWISNWTGTIVENNVESTTVYSQNIINILVTDTNSCQSSLNIELTPLSQEELTLNWAANDYECGSGSYFDFFYDESLIQIFEIIKNESDTTSFNNVNLPTFAHLENGSYEFHLIGACGDSSYFVTKYVPVPIVQGNYNITALCNGGAVVSLGQEPGWFDIVYLENVATGQIYAGLDSTAVEIPNGEYSLMLEKCSSLLDTTFTVTDQYELNVISAFQAGPTVSLELSNSFLYETINWTYLNDLNQLVTISGNPVSIPIEYNIQKNITLNASDNNCTKERLITSLLEKDVVPIYDTVIVVETVYDTTFTYTNIIDTTYISIIDTVPIYDYETILVYDTIYTQIVDTTIFVDTTYTQVFIDGEIVPENPTGFVVYPNPFREKFTISSDFIFTDFQLYDDIGKLVKYEYHISTNILTVTGFDLSMGTYIGRIMDSQGSWHPFKVIKDNY